MWHALGSLKKFGYSVIEKKEGSNLSDVAKMHKNYDYILTSSKQAGKNFAEAFNYSEDYMKIIPLPRVDYLMDKQNQQEITKKIKKEYPILKKKKNIVYAPTFRKNGEDVESIKKLIEAVDYENYNLILKLHPLTKIEIKDTKAIYDKQFPTIEWLNVADYIITDYSAIVYEAALLKKPLYFYVYDFKEYETGRDFYLNYKKEMPGVIKKDAKDIVKSIEKNEIDNKKLETFNNTYVDYHNQNCTQELVDLILKCKGE
jgi:CDP-ribitol ribitolphosphotransferase